MMPIKKYTYSQNNRKRNKSAENAQPHISWEEVVQLMIMIYLKRTFFTLCERSNGRLITFIKYSNPYKDTQLNLQQRFHTYTYDFEVRLIEGHTYEMYVLQRFKKCSYLWVANMFSPKQTGHICMKITNFEDSICWIGTSNARDSTTPSTSTSYDLHINGVMMRANMQAW